MVIIARVLLKVFNKDSYTKGKSDNSVCVSGILRTLRPK